MSFLGNPKIIVMAQDCVPVANYEVAGNPTASINPKFAPCTWLNTLTGWLFLCTDNTPGENVWKLISGFRGALVYKAAAEGDQDITTGGSNTPVTFAAESYDTDAFHDPATNNSRLTIPAGVSKIKLSAGVRWDDGVSANKRRILSLWKNGGEFVGSSTAGYDPNSTTGNFLSTASPVIACTEGDYFECAVYQDSGSTIAIKANDNGRCWFAVEVVE